jgi:hypothetical protein
MFNFLDNLFNTKNVQKEVTSKFDNLQAEIPANLQGKFIPVCAYLSKEPVSLKPQFVLTFNEIFKANFTESDQIRYYVCLIKILLEQEYWMVRYMFFSDSEQVQDSKMYVDILDAIEANSLPNIIFDRPELEVYLFENKEKTISEIAGEIDDWVKENKKES